ncbi:MAG: MarR family transcriptional regulator, partial [Cellulomonadaceae bacterium]|nr:MarR family transcriptional regulator [Cellulomonadaceae bacterium]
MGPDGVDRIREQWAVERPELETEPMGIFGRVWRIARLAGEVMEDAYALHGITRADFDVLATLRRAGEPFTLSPSALTASLMLTSGGTTGRLDRLERAGLVRRAPDPDD